MRNPIFKTITLRTRDRVLRIGSWDTPFQHISMRYGYEPPAEDEDLGFRLFRTKEQK